MTPNRVRDGRGSALRTHHVAQRERWADTMMSDEEELTKVHLNLPNHRAVGSESVSSSRIRSRGARPGHILGSFQMNALASSVRALNCQDIEILGWAAVQQQHPDGMEADPPPKAAAGG